MLNYFESGEKTPYLKLAEHTFQSLILHLFCLIQNSYRNLCFLLHANS